MTNDEETKLNDIKGRYELKKGSFCEIYSRSKNKWLKAMVGRVHTNGTGEWLEVKNFTLIV